MDYPHITSAGAIILSLIEGVIHIALSRDLGKGINAWVIPKGLVEPNESYIETAKREIIEETGLVNVELLCYLGRIERISEHHFSNEIFFKTIHLFLGYTKDPIPRVKITDPEIAEMKWFLPHETLDVIPFKEDVQFVKKILNKLATFEKWP